MKKNVLLTLAGLSVLMLVPVNSHAQGFLKKLRQKVEKAVGLEEPKEEEVDEMENTSGKQLTRKVTPADKLPKRRAATARWDDIIAPSKAASAEALMKELPLLPSVEELAYPSEVTREAYYKKLVSVDLRVEELDKQFTCSDQEMIAYRDKMYAEAAETLGLTVEEMKLLEDDNIPDAEKERLLKKMESTLLGNTGSLFSAAAELQTLEKEKGRELTDEERMAFLSAHPELMQDAMTLAGKMNGNNTLNTRSMRMEQSLLKMNDRMRALRNADETISTNCRKIADEYEAELKSIYEKIHTTDDCTEISSLYTRADELMKNYRTRAADIWRSSLQKRTDAAKKMYPELVALQQQMVDEGMIPACAQRRAPLNLVTECSNILHKAYADFPQATVLPVKMEPLPLKIDEGESLLIAESGFATSVDGFLEGSCLYTINYNTGERFLYENGKKRKLSAKDPSQFETKTPAKSTYGNWTSADGKRKVTYARDGSLTLHDGTAFYPLAFKKEGDRLVWICIPSTSGIRKCTYKL